MGLAERRAVKEFQDKVLPGFQKQVDEIVGKHVPLEVSWDQLALDGYGDRYETLWTRAGFEPLIKALGEVARDDLGREALAASLRSVRVLGEYAHAVRATFSDGVLTIDFRLWNPPSADDAAEYVKRIRQCLERAL